MDRNLQIANEGLRPAPYVVESIERDGETLYRHRQTATPVNSVDQAAFYQLKTMLQGVIARGTASAISDLAPYVAGKTGTSDDENDAWFVGLTKDVTVAVWIGYDNAEGKRRTLGGGSTGGAVAVPIFEPIINAVWSNVAPRTVLAPPSPEAKRPLACKSIGRGQAFSECFRVNAKGKVIDTENVLLSGKGSESDRLLKNYARLEAGAADSKEEADDFERLTGVKAQADPDDEPEVRRTRRAKRARAQSDDARKDRKARSSKYGRTKTKRDGDQVNSARATALALLLAALLRGMIPGDHNGIGRANTGDPNGTGRVNMGRPPPGGAGVSRMSTKPVPGVICGEVWQTGAERGARVVLRISRGTPHS